MAKKKEKPEFEIGLRWVAKRYRIGTERVSFLIKHGNLPHLRIGRAFRFKEKEVDEYFNNKDNEKYINPPKGYRIGQKK